MQGIPPYSAEPATLRQIVVACLYVAAVATIVLGIVAWSIAPIVRDIRQRRAMPRKISVARHGKRTGRVVPHAPHGPDEWA